MDNQKNHTRYWLNYAYYTTLAVVATFVAIRRGIPSPRFVLYPYISIFLGRFADFFSTIICLEDTLIRESAPGLGPYPKPKRLLRLTLFQCGIMVAIFFSLNLFSSKLGSALSLCVMLQGCAVSVGNGWLGTSVLFGRTLAAVRKWLSKHGESLKSTLLFPNHLKFRYPPLNPYNLPNRIPNNMIRDFEDAIMDHDEKKINRLSDHARFMVNLYDEKRSIYIGSHALMWFRPILAAILTISVAVSITLPPDAVWYKYISDPWLSCFILVFACVFYSLPQTWIVTNIWGLILISKLIWMIWEKI